jgi:hypothetical protein
MPGEEERSARWLAALDGLEELRQQIARHYPPPDDGLTDAEWIQQERERRMDRIEETVRSPGSAQGQETR